MKNQENESFLSDTYFNFSSIYFPDQDIFSTLTKIPESLTVKEIVYPRKLDVPSTIGNICDLQEFFSGIRHTRAIAHKEMECCKTLLRN